MNTLWSNRDGGMQATLDGGTVEYFAKAIEKQVSLDDQLKLQEYKEVGNGHTDAPHVSPRETTVPGSLLGDGPDLQ